VSNWRDIDTSTPEGLHELNKVIAQRLSDSLLVFFEVDNGLSGIEIHSHRIDRDEPWFVVPNYSTVTDNALKLVRNLPKGFQFLFRNRPKGYWTAGIQCKYDSSKDSFAKSESPAIAICLAWLGHGDIQAVQK